MPEKSVDKRIMERVLMLLEKSGNEEYGLNYLINFIHSSYTALEKPPTEKFEEELIRYLAELESILASQINNPEYKGDPTPYIAGLKNMIAQEYKI